MNVAAIAKIRDKESIVAKVLVIENFMYFLFSFLFLIS
jgi:hypothetical protein